MPIAMFPLGETGVLVQFGNHIDEETHQAVMQFVACLERHPFPGLIEYVPAYTTVAINYDPFCLPTIAAGADSRWGAFPEESFFHRVSVLLERVIAVCEAEIVQSRRQVEIPVCYGGEFGPDLHEVAAYHGLSPEDVIRIHAEGEYLVYMIGFMPGFPYLGGLSQKIATPRRHTPRLKIPAGAIGIAGSQTGIYPLESPGGWQIIGRTPLRLFSPECNPPCYLEAGDRIRFIPVTADEFRQLEKQKVREVRVKWDSREARESREARGGERGG